MRLNIRIAGAGGQGVILSSVMIAKAYGLGENLNISQTQSYGPEARGGACKAEVVISDEDIDYMKVDDADIFIAYNQAGYDKYSKNIAKDAIVIINSTLVETSDTGLNFHRIPATEMAEKLGKAQVVNMIMVGALTKILPKLHYDKVVDQMRDNFNEKLIDINLQAFDTGYRFLQNSVLQNIYKQSKDSYTAPEMRTMVDYGVTVERKKIAAKLKEEGMDNELIASIVGLQPEEVSSLSSLALKAIEA